MKQLLKLKNKNPHPSCVIYEGMRVCNETLLVRPGRLLELDGTNMKIPEKTRISTSKHIRSHTDHLFSWNTLLSVPANSHGRKMMGVLIIALNSPTLNGQVDSQIILFRNGVSW